MPYKSEAQRRYFNSSAGKAKIGKEEVEHWNEVSKGKELPEKAVDKALAICDEWKIEPYSGHYVLKYNGSIEGHYDTKAEAYRDYQKEISPVEFIVYFYVDAPESSYDSGFKMKTVKARNENEAIKKIREVYSNYKLRDIKVKKK